MRGFVLWLTAMILAMVFDTNTRKRKRGDQNLLNDLRKLDANNLELWRYFSDRGDKLAQQLWTTGTWIFAIIGAVLALPFASKFIVVDSKNYLIRFESPQLAIPVCIVGLLLCAYLYAALKDMREHIERNWTRAKLVLTDQWEEASWVSSDVRRRRLYGWRVLMIFAAGSAVAFVLIIALAFLWIFWTDAFLRQS